MSDAPPQCHSGGAVSNLLIGASSWTGPGWVGPFYPLGTVPAQFLAEYARRFPTVEVESTFYAIPSAPTVCNWRDRTPPGFVFAAKFPRTITHEKVLADCALELRQFLSVMELLGEKLGPLLVQLPYFNRQAFLGLDEFLARLVPFLDTLPRGHRFAVEIRNRAWLAETLLESLRERNIALALIDHVWMPTISQVFARMDPITADFAYVRWLGDRQGIEKVTKTWERLRIDRTLETEDWAEVLQRLHDRGIKIYGYFNNHYGGFAPGSIELFYKTWDRNHAA